MAGYYLCLMIRCCSRFQKSLKSLQNADQCEKKSLGDTSVSPDLGRNEK